MTAPLFSPGQQVSDHDGERPGIVVKVGEYDPHAKGWRYLVAATAGGTKWRNEGNLMPVASGRWRSNACGKAPPRCTASTSRPRAARPYKRSRG